jgi:membrane protein DedA with SNARE-associated domain
VNLTGPWGVCKGEWGKKSRAERYRGLSHGGFHARLSAWRTKSFMLHELVRTWFGWVEAWGYFGVFLLMAMESSIIPVPSEVVMPPAAFWAAQGRMNLAAVILAGTAGSYFGSLLNYWVARWVGQPVVNRYGKYFLMSPEKLKMAEGWIARFGTPGVFLARLLPVVRHLISIPAGILKMPLGRFSAATILGAGLWCGVLSWFGQEVLGSHPELLQSPEAMIHALKEKLHWFVLAVVLLALLYGVVAWMKRSRAAVDQTDVTSASS